MLRTRNVEIVVGLTLALLIPLLGFLSSDDSVQITGYAVYEGAVEGPEFTAVVQGQLYLFRFMDGRWFQSRQDGWEYRPDMGDTIPDGLLYLESYGAEIFQDGQRITAKSYEGAGR